MKKILAVLAAIVAVFAFIQTRRVNVLSSENKRLEGNQRALLGKVDYYRTEAGEYAASVQALRLEKEELEESRADLVKQVASLNVKLKRVQALSQTVLETQLEATAPVRDTLIIRDSLPAIAPVFTWFDPWVRVTGIIRTDSTVSLNVHSIDTLHQVIHRVPKKFWFIRYGTKAIRQEITSSNPHTRIVYTEYIEIKK